MPNTKRSDAGSFVNSTGSGRRPLSSRRFRGLPVLVSLILILILSLAACGGKTGDGGPTAAPVGSPAGAIISTVPATGGPAGQPAGRPATAAPTAAPPTPTLTPTPPAPLAASVNGQYIFLADYERRVAQFEQAMVSQGLDPNSSDGQASLAQIRQQVLDSMIDYALIEQGSAALGVAVSDADLEAQIAADIEAGGGQAAFDQWLQATGQTRDDYKEMLRESLLSQGVMDAIAADVPDAVEQVHARQIVLDSEAAAQEVLTALRQGGDFVALARERSVDVATRDNGGDLGWFPRGLIAPELEAAAFALQPGEISDVIPLGEQYHIVQVVERDATRALSAEQKVDLRFALFDRWLAQQRDGAVIERLVGE